MLVLFGVGCLNEDVDEVWFVLGGCALAVAGGERDCEGSGGEEKERDESGGGVHFDGFGGR